MPGTERRRWNASASWRFASRTIVSSRSMMSASYWSISARSTSMLLRTLGSAKVLDDAVAIGRDRRAAARRPGRLYWARVFWMWARSWPRLRTRCSRRRSRSRVDRIAAGIDVGLRQHAAAQQHGDLVRVDLVVLGLAAVDGLHRERVAEHERDAFGGADVGEPVPGEHALGRDDQIRRGTARRSRGTPRASTARCGARAPGRRASRMQTYIVFTWRSIPQ